MRVPEAEFHWGSRNRSRRPLPLPARSIALPSVSLVQHVVRRVRVEVNPNNTERPPHHSHHCHPSLMPTPTYSSGTESKEVNQYRRDVAMSNNKRNSIDRRRRKIGSKKEREKKSRQFWMGLYNGTCASPNRSRSFPCGVNEVLDGIHDRTENSSHTEEHRE